MKKNMSSIIAVAFLLFVGGIAISMVDALTLEDAPVSAALGKVKTIINSNNTLIEVALGSSGTESPTFDVVTVSSLISGVYTGKTEVVTNIIGTFTSVTTYVDGLYIGQTTDP
jgi:hypothetical protein